MKKENSFKKELTPGKIVLGIVIIVIAIFIGSFLGAEFFELVEKIMA